MPPGMTDLRQRIRAKADFELSSSWRTDHSAQVHGVRDGMTREVDYLCIVAE